MLAKRTITAPKALRAAIHAQYRMNEKDSVARLIEAAQLSETACEAIRLLATRLVEQVRALRKKTTGIDSFLTEYTLSTEEGIALMCLAEALLRVPDQATIDSLIKDKLADVDWKSHQGQSHSFFVNATTWALVLTGKVLSAEKAESKLTQAIQSLFHRGGEHMVRIGVEKAMRIMSKQFVMGRTIHEALTRAKKKETMGYRYSYDMLGEAALTAEDAERYFQAYTRAIEAIGRSCVEGTTLYTRPGISIKLSALHPRYQESQHERVMAELPPKLLSLAQLAKHYNISLTIDAEESERLDLSLDVIARVFEDQSLGDWQGFGLAVQSYQKRALDVLEWVAALARSQKRRMMVRLIKGAYWDSEIKKTQMQGLSDYPVFTRKTFTDVSFQACAKKLLTLTDDIYPQFATHNAYSVALILNLVGSYRDFEFQCLHGMGQELYEQVVDAKSFNIPCRIYAPVGSHEDLLPYLVRRLLENGANSSFVNRIVDDSAPISELVADPVKQAVELLSYQQPSLPLPSALFLPERQNSIGLDWTDRTLLAQLQQDISEMAPYHWTAGPLLAAGKRSASTHTLSVTSPQANERIVGQVTYASQADIEAALTDATQAASAWGETSVEARAACLERLADLYETHRLTLMLQACLEAGKTWPDALAEVREAVDFCRYYAVMARKIMTAPTVLSGYTGELNEWSLHPRGVLLCISPWNFPLAIFTGQVVAALVTGHAVLAKPAEQTPLIAHFAVELMREAGIPEAVIQLLPGEGRVVGAALVQDVRVKGVIFTGSTQTATLINRTLAAREDEIVPLIAETGGQNAMIVDSSALLEQVIVDVITSAFGSAGQRCSALRVVYVQKEVYPRFIALLKGAMAELVIGDPALLATDVGPVIDALALKRLQTHVAHLLEKHELIYQCPLTEAHQQGHFMPPTAIAIHQLSVLEKEVFGPILHVMCYERDQLDQVIEEINQTQYGLTLGIHSRINQTAAYIRKHVHVGNCYVNRNMIGAVVGLQPFGGEGRSGTGPKAGGPLYLQRLCHERTYTVDTTAAGGNATLMATVE